ncbi:MAG: ribosome-associated translation inhibitor RaiA [Planctomycetota bacterium]|nr:ribosome-associated translation inhibitor RaiA [Planctomycetota bacterium]
MRIEVTGRGIDLTDAIERHADTKCQKLLKFYDGIMEIRVVLEKASNVEFSAEIVADVVKHDNFVAVGKGEDIYGCIDQAVDKMTRQLHDFKEKLRDVKR